MIRAERVVAARATEALLPTYAPFPTNTSAPIATAAPATTASGVTPTAGPVINTLINDIASRATLYLDSLDEAQRTKTSYAFNDPELTRCCLLYTSPSPRDRQKSRMPSSA